MDLISEPTKGQSTEAIELLIVDAVTVCVGAVSWCEEVIVY